MLSRIIIYPSPTYLLITDILESYHSNSYRVKTWRFLFSILWIKMFIYPDVSGSSQH